MKKRILKKNIKNNIFIIPLILFFSKIAIAENIQYAEVKARSDIISWLILFLIIVLIAIMIYSIIIIRIIKRLNLNKKQILKSIGICLLVMVIIEIVYYFIGLNYNLFMVLCEEGGNCPTEFEAFLSQGIIIAPALFLLSLFIYYIFMYFNKKNKKIKK